jgi:hypothetical protein
MIDGEGREAQVPPAVPRLPDGPVRDQEVREEEPEDDGEGVPRLATDGSGTLVGALDGRAAPVGRAFLCVAAGAKGVDRVGLDSELAAESKRRQTATKPLVPEKTT